MNKHIVNTAAKRIAKYNGNVTQKRHINIRIYCEKLGLPIPDKKKRERFLYHEYYREGSPIKKGIKFKPKVKYNYSKYVSYLMSEKWFEFKKMLFAMRGRRCEICQTTKGQIHGHHLTYERLYNEKPEDVQLLCQSCHRDIHKKKKKVMTQPTHQYKNIDDVPLTKIGKILSIEKSIAVKSYLITDSCYDSLKQKYANRQN